VLVRVYPEEDSDERALFVANIYALAR
jgi:hypothetical protein